MFVLSRRATALALCAALSLASSYASAQQGSPPVAAAAANSSARSDASLRRTEQGAETQRRLTDARLKQRELDARKSLGSICKGC